MLRKSIRQFLYGNSEQQVPAKDIILVFLGVFFLGFGLFAMLFGISRGKPAWALWSCYIAMIIMGIGTLRKNSFWVASQVNILAVPLIAWNLDLFYQVITGRQLWGITNYFFEPLLPVARFISLEHFFMVPLGIYLIYLLKLDQKGSWKISFITLSLTFMATFYFTDPELNVNCTFERCMSILPTTLYPASYLAALFSMAFLTSIVLERIPALNKK